MWWYKGHTKGFPCTENGGSGDGGMTVLCWGYGLLYQPAIKKERWNWRRGPAHNRTCADQSHITGRGHSFLGCRRGFFAIVALLVNRRPGDRVPAANAVPVGAAVATGRVLAEWCRFGSHRVFVGPLDGRRGASARFGNTGCAAAVFHKHEGRCPYLGQMWTYWGCCVVQPVVWGITGCVRSFSDVTG